MSKSKSINIYLQQATTMKMFIRGLSNNISILLCIFVVQIFMVAN